MNFKKHLLSSILILSSLSGFCQITPQWKSVTGGLMSYFYPGKSPVGYDTLWNAQTIRGYVASHSALYSGSQGITLTGNDFQLGGILTEYKQIGGDAEFEILQSDSTFDNISRFDITKNLIHIERGISLGNSHYLNFDPNNISLGSLSSIGGRQELVFSTSSTSSDSYPIVLTDALRKGILYNWLNDSNLSDSSLVPKRYVDSISARGTPIDSALRVNKNLYDISNKAIARINIGLNGTHTPGYGLSGSNYNATANQTWTADTTSATGLVSKSRANANYVYLFGTYSNPSWITALAWSKITGTPTTKSGYGITDVMAYADTASAYANLAHRNTNNTFTGLNTIQRTTTQLRLGYDVSNFVDFTTSSTGALTITPASNIQLAGIVSITGGATGNIYVPSTTGTGSTNTAKYLFAGASNVSVRTAVGGSTTSNTIPTNNSYASFLVSGNPETTAASGTHALMASFVANPVTITTGTATATNSATIFINGKGTGATNNYVSWFGGAGTNRIDGDIQLTNPTAGTGGTDSLLVKGASDKLIKRISPAFYGAIGASNTWTAANTFQVNTIFQGGIESQTFGLFFRNGASPTFTTTLIGTGNLANRTITLPDESGEALLNVSGTVSTTGTATTIFTVTIGATQANTTYKVQVTPTSSVAAAVFYISNKTTTTFDVVYLTGLTGAVSFDWMVVK